MTATVLGLTLLASYLIGAVPFGYLVARWRGVDIFAAGSGNIGATNVGRVLGRRFGILVFVLDLAKGALPVLAAGWVTEATPEVAIRLGLDGLRVAAGLAAVLGHMFSVYLRFRGGKGVATGAGVVAVLLPGPTLAALLAWVVVVAATRYVSLASLTAAAVLCVARLALTPGPLAPQNAILTLFCLVAAGLVLARHRANIGRLLRGTENRFRETPAMAMLFRVVHVLSLGLWFGMSVFFTFVVAPTLFATFDAEAAKPKEERALWLPLPPEYDRDLETRKEQGSRVAGAAVSPIFRPYFLLQLVCGALALATALPWTKVGTVHRVRTAVLGLALAGALAGWWLDGIVAELRVTRNQTSETALRKPTLVSEEVQAAADARAEFRTWHSYSLMVNFVTISLVMGAMGLAACLPAAPSRSASVAEPNPVEAGVH